MSAYVLIESRDANTTPAVAGTVNMAAELNRQGYQVTLILLKSGLPQDYDSEIARRLMLAASSGVQVVADLQSLKERGIQLNGLPQNFLTKSMDAIVQGVQSDDIVIWH